MAMDYRDVILPRLAGFECPNIQANTALDVFKQTCARVEWGDDQRVQRTRVWRNNPYGGLRNYWVCELTNVRLEKKARCW